MSNENTGVERGGKCTGEKWIKLLDEGNLWLFSRNGKLHHILQNSYSKIYMMMIISSSFCGLEISSSIARIQLQRNLPYFLYWLSSVKRRKADMIHLWEHLEKINWLKIELKWFLCIHPRAKYSTKKILEKAFLEVIFLVGFFICLSQFCKLIYQSDLVIHCFSDISWIIRDKTLQSIQAYNNTTLKEKFHLALTRNLQKHDSAFT